MVFCEACNAHFEPIRKREQCPRCERDAALAKVKRLEGQLDDLKSTLSAMNEIALRPSGLT